MARAVAALIRQVARARPLAGVRRHEEQSIVQLAPIEYQPHGAEVGDAHVDLLEVQHRVCSQHLQSLSTQAAKQPRGVARVVQMGRSLASVAFFG